MCRCRRAATLCISCHKVDTWLCQPHKPPFYNTINTLFITAYDTDTEALWRNLHERWTVEEGKAIKKDYDPNESRWDEEICVPAQPQVVQGHLLPKVVPTVVHTEEEKDKIHEVYRFYATLYLMYCICFMYILYKYIVEYVYNMFITCFTCDLLVTLYNGCLKQHVVQNQHLHNYAVQCTMYKICTKWTFIKQHIESNPVCSYIII